MDLSASGKPSELSAIMAEESAKKASILNASCAASALPSTSDRSKGLSAVSASGARRTFTPPRASMRLPYSPAGSKMMISSVGYESTVLVISRLTENDLPEPGFPQTNPMGLASFLRLQMTRLPDCLDWP